VRAASQAGRDRSSISARTGSRAEEDATRSGGDWATPTIQRHDGSSGAQPLEPGRRRPGRDHNGTIDVQSDPERGTTFTLTFPQFKALLA
jgi:hypothetical protein